MNVLYIVKWARVLSKREGMNDPAFGGGLFLLTLSVIPMVLIVNTNVEMFDVEGSTQDRF